jgi:hypothetical protein
VRCSANQEKASAADARSKNEGPLLPTMHHDIAFNFVPSLISAVAQDAGSPWRRPSTQFVASYDKISFLLATEGRLRHNALHQPMVVACYSAIPIVNGDQSSILRLDFCDLNHGADST